MKQLQLKICGVKTVETAELLVRLKVPYIGMIFYDKSPRNLSIEDAKALANVVDGRAKLVAVTVNPERSFIEDIVRNVGIDYLQLHGDESMERVNQIRRAFDFQIIKAIGVVNASDIDKAREYADVADILLLDKKPEPGDSNAGGFGKKFDWNLLHNAKFSKPWLLAGGIDSSNLVDAYNIAKPSGFDVSSGVESGPGVKSAEKIVALVEKFNSLQA